jgi:[acyl-carrier-protein] S-malonyltransferase
MAKDPNGSWGIKRGVLLPVSAPFHCSLMKPAAEAMDDALGRTAPRPFRLPLYPNVTAAECTDPAAERLLLVEQVTGRVRWRESVLAMKAAGVDHFVELGGKVLAPMVSRTVEDVTAASVVTMADIEALAKEL